MDFIESLWHKCSILFRLWGAQTQRSLQNFDIGGEREQMPEPIIRAFGVLKKCAAKVSRFFIMFRATIFILFTIRYDLFVKDYFSTLGNVS